MRNIRHGLFLLATASCFGGTFTFYSSQSDFQAAISSLPQQTITFNDLAPGEYTPLVSGGATFTGDARQSSQDPFAQTVVIFSESNWTFPFFGSATGNSLAAIGNIKIALPSGVSAVGFLVGATGVNVVGFSSTENVTADSAASFVTATPSNLFPFIGVVSDGTISTVNIHSSGSFLTIDNVNLAGTSIAPEPSTGLLLAFSIGVLALRQRINR